MGGRGAEGGRVGRGGRGLGGEAEKAGKMKGGREMNPKNGCLCQKKD